MQTACRRRSGTRRTGPAKFGQPGHLGETQARAKVAVWSEAAQRGRSPANASSSLPGRRHNSRPLSGRVPHRLVAAKPPTSELLISASCLFGLRSDSVLSMQTGTSPIHCGRSALPTISFGRTRPGRGCPARRPPCCEAREADQSWVSAGFRGRRCAKRGRKSRIVQVKRAASRADPLRPRPHVHPMAAVIQTLLPWSAP